MKTVGIIAEYNPFHNGHALQLRKAMEASGADYAVIVMSGDFVQRGAPAMYAKHIRTKTALSCGADLVLELPVFGVTSAARDFAAAGVSLLNKTGITDSISFGSECGNLGELLRMRDRLLSEDAEISARIREGLRAGYSWPKAVALANDTAGPVSPNDILAVEYLRALKETGASMEPIPIARTDSGYHSETLDGPLASATAIRRAILDPSDRNNPARYDSLKAVLPEEFFSVLAKETDAHGICAEPDCSQLPLPSGLEIVPDDFTLLLNAAFRTKTLSELSEIHQMPADLPRRLYRERLSFRPFTEWISFAKTRQVTYSHVSRALMNLVLGITKDEFSRFRDANSAPWIRILGFKKSAAPLLSALRANAAVPLITAPADAKRQLSEPDLALFFKSLEVSELYRLIAEEKTGRSVKNEYTRPLVIL